MDAIKLFFSIANKYLGFQYVWAGSCPETSFDCSGYICWVINESGVFRTNRLNALEIYEQLCNNVDLSNIQQGDFVFFRDTYKTNRAITHVGVYFTGDLILHCGESNGVEYIHLTNSKLLQKIHCIGRPIFFLN